MHSRDTTHHRQVDRPTLQMCSRTVKDLNLYTLFLTVIVHLGYLCINILCAQNITRLHRKGIQLRRAGYDGTSGKYSNCTKALGNNRCYVALYEEVIKLVAGCHCSTNCPPNPC